LIWKEPKKELSVCPEEVTIRMVVFYRFELALFEKAADPLEERLLEKGADPLEETIFPVLRASPERGRPPFRIGAEFAW
jgi:hypothetical protein